jgi:cytoskeletal protein CcmA (bactofilin family)
MRSFLATSAGCPPDLSAAPSRSMLGLIKLFRSSKDDSPPPVLSIIGDDTTIRGDTIEGTGDLRIEDTIRADIVRDGRVVIAGGGALYGTVRARSINVHGTVRGELHAEGTLVVGTSSDVEARLQADALTIESGAGFKGVVHDEDGVPSSLAVSSGDHLPAPVDAVEDSGAISRKHGQ